MATGVAFPSRPALPFPPTMNLSQTSSSTARAELLRDQPFLGLKRTAESPPTLTVCQQCARLDFDSLPPIAEGAIPHHKYGDLVESAEKCQACRVIQYAALEQREMIIQNVKRGDRAYRWGPPEWTTGPVPEIDPQTRVWLFGAWKAAATTMTPHWLIGLGCMLSAKDDRVRLLARDSDGSMEKATFIPSASVRICTTFSDPMGSVVPGRVREEDPASEATFALAERWMDVCKNQHDCEPEGSLLPDRVIAIDTDGDTMALRLVETRREPRKYVALSHSWGRGPRMILTTTNIDSMKQNMPFSEMPKTFQDAVVITKRLGLQYLWIDSLCIIQDSPSDWATQSMLMASIYAGATLTICATGSSSDDEGVLLSRSAVYNPPDYTAGIRDMRTSAVAAASVKTSSGQLSRLTFFPQRSNDGGVHTLPSPLDPVSQDPLNTRAWAFQERILSPRKLMYGEDQLYWECTMSLFSEDGSRGQTTTPLMFNIINSEKAQSGRERRRNGWPRLVAAYSQGRLTYQSDKFTALAGLASEIGNATSATYYAGVWSSHLWSDLLWHVHLETESSPAGYTFVEDFRAYEEKYHGPIPVSDPEQLHPWVDQSEKWRRVVCPQTEPLPSDTKVRELRRNADFGEMSKSGFTLARAKTYVAPTWSFGSVDAPVTYPYAEDPGLGTVAYCRSIRTELDGQTEYGRLKGGSVALKV